ncbi:hypothetical protein ACP70R_025062 [Stipagrostis hirtigluma subsp. patula]
MGGALAASVAVVATAFHLLALCGAAARPQLAAATSGTTKTTTTAAAATAAFALPPGDHQRRGVAADAAARAGKWLPYAGVIGGGAHHIPAAGFWARRPAPWAGVLGKPPALGGGVGVGAEGEEGEVVRERDRPYAGGGATTRQEQLAMWASLLNPKRKGRPSSGWLPSPGIGEATDDEQVKPLDGDAEGTEVDEPATGGERMSQTKPEFWGNNGN